MSSIIKSSRVIERSIVSEKNIKNEEKDNTLDEKLLEEAREKYKKILEDAGSEAKIILASAQEKSNKQISKAAEDAIKISEKAEKDGYEAGYKTGKKEGHEKGYSVGYGEGKNESEKLIIEALDIKNQYIEEKSKLLEDVEKDLIDLVISIYEKVIYEKVEEDEETIVSLVLNGIDNLEISEKLTIIVSKDNYEAVEKSKNIILAKASLIEKLDIRVNSDMGKGDCVLETSKGSVDVSIDNQLEEVKELLTRILNNE